MHVPDANNDAVLPETVQTLVVLDVKVMGKPELLEALKEMDPPTASVGMAANVIVCDDLLMTAMITPIGVAAA